MDFSLSKEQMAIEKRCQEFANQEISNVVPLLEEDLEARHRLFQKMAKAGFFLLNVAKKQGGNFTDTISYILALKSIAAVDAGISVTMAVTNMVAETIALYGSEAQRQNYLPRIAKGECVPLSFALTEKEAGSDAKNIQTSAKLDPNDSSVYILNGEKQFITNGDLAGVLIVMAKTDFNQGSAGITAFLVDRGTPGLHVVKKEKKLGLLTANLVDLSFVDCRIPADHILGKKGEGFKVAMTALDSGRIGIAAQAIGIAEAAFNAALKHAQQRQQFGHPLAENQAIAFKLADMQVKLSAGSLLLFKACWLKDQGMPFNREASEAKLFCSEACNEIVNEALQIYGGYGYVKDYPLEKYFRDARVTTLYEGTSEIQRIIISRHILQNGQKSGQRVDKGSGL
jgi:alkylation response protein AidB-like acyl-CoA dehydrogenase